MITPLPNVVCKSDQHGQARMCCCAAFVCDADEPCTHDQELAFHSINIFPHVGRLVGTRHARFDATV
jgi:hypothetical protein